MLCSLLLIPPLMKLAVRFKFVDTPDERKVHTGAIPRIGGIAMVFGSLTSILLFSQLDQRTLAFIIATLVLAAFGMWDDRVQLGYRIKFVGQLLASFIVIFFADIKIDSMSFLYHGIIPDIYAIPFTIFVLLGAMNAINLSDGLDGLAGGGALLSLGVIAILGYQAGDIPFVMITLAVMGSVFGFLRFNTHPAVIFMGDTGSQFLGFAIGVLTIILIQDVNPVLSPSIGMVILGLPILDTFIVICTRLLNGKSPFKPDKNHIHHKLLDIGLDHYEVVFVIYLIQSMMVICAYFFRYYQDYAILFYYILFGILINILLVNLKPKHSVVAKDSKTSLMKRLLGSVGGRRPFLVLTISSILLLFIPTFFSWVVFSVGTIPITLLAIAAMLLFTIIGSQFYPKTEATELIIRIGLYAVSTFSIYLMYTEPELLTTSRSNLNIIFGVLALLIVIGLMMPDRGKVSITPLDYIIIFVVMSFTIFTSSLDDAAIGFASLIAWLFVLFYASEYLLMTIRKHQYTIKGVLLICFTSLLVSGFM